jgi:hypothetical protein
MGQNPPVIGQTEEWNGVNWVEVADLSTARKNLVGALRGTTTASLAFGGEPGSGVTTATEHWSGSSVTTRSIDTD